MNVELVVIVYIMYVEGRKICKPCSSANKISEYASDTYPRPLTMCSLTTSLPSPSVQWKCKWEKLYLSSRLAPSMHGCWSAAHKPVSVTKHYNNDTRFTLLCTIQLCYNTNNYITTDNNWYKIYSYIDSVNV